MLLNVVIDGDLRPAEPVCVCDIEKRGEIGKGVC